MDSHKSTNCERICRICLHIVENGHNLFSSLSTSTETVNKIYLCFQIILSYDSYLPNLICAKCIEELEMANNFRLKCASFEERFLAYCKSLSEVTEDYSNNEFDNMSRNSDDAVCLNNSENMHEQKDYSQTQNTTFNKFVCNICNKVLKTSISLTKHTISMHQKRKHVGKVTGTGANRRYHCTKCTYSTPHSQTLVNHMRRHDGERPYQCHCGKSFTQSSSLGAHQKTHSDTTYFTCSTCGKQFKHAFTLKKHLRVHSTGTFCCDICQKVLKSQQSLQEHMHRHYNIRNYNCEECGSTFVSSADLINHRKKHDVEKKAECHLCGYKTNAKKNLVVHLKRHTGDKSHKCEVCAVTVYTSSDLRQHMRVHTREKPFSCPTCAQRFSHSTSLNKHARNVHGIQYRWGDYNSIHSRRSIKNEVSQ